MKIPLKLLLITVACLALASAEREHIRWDWGGRPGPDGHKFGYAVDFGLRNDGVVVWRERIPASTNSPAECEIPAVVLTNLWISP